MSGTKPPNFKSDDKPAKQDLSPPKCGIVMPISAADGCTEQHWIEVQEIISDAVISAGLDPCMVSASDDVGVIQKRIIQNLYENPIVIADVSTKNPNVMLELGIRLAFDKPAIIVKDDCTTYSFDTAPIEHIKYPRDLRFGSIVAFKQELAKKLHATLTASISNPEHTTFLKHFGTFQVARLETKEVDKEDFILQELHDLRMLITRTTHENSREMRRSVRRTLSKSIALNAIEEWLTKQNIQAKQVLESTEMLRLLSAYVYAHIDVPGLFENPEIFSTFVRESLGELAAQGR